MHAPWKALQKSLLRSIQTIEARLKFDELRKKFTVLSRFENPLLLRSYLTSKEGDLNEKDAIYAVLVEMVHAGKDDASLATSLLWLGLWPALDAIYGRRMRFFTKPKALVSEIGYRFTTAIHRANLSRINRLAATLTMNTDRQIGEGLKRKWASAARRARLNEKGSLAGQKDPMRSWEPTELGMVPGLPLEDEIAAIRELLDPLVGDDTGLVIGTVIYGESQREAGERLGLTHEAARKRFQRAMDKIRRFFAEKNDLSHPACPARVFYPDFVIFEDKED